MEKRKDFRHCYTAVTTLLCLHTEHTCASTYCSTKTMAAVTSRNRESKADDNPDPKKRLKQQDGPKFDFRKNCLYCGRECKVEKDSKNPGQWIPAYQFREIEKRGSSKTIKQSVLDICLPIIQGLP